MHMHAAHRRTMMSLYVVAMGVPVLRWRPARRIRPTGRISGFTSGPRFAISPPTKP